MRIFFISKGEEGRYYFYEHKEKIIKQIKTRTYKPQPVKRVEIPKPDGGIRNLGIPCVIDRIIQQAINQVLTPIYEEQFCEYSYGFRPKRDCHMAINKSLEYLNEGYNIIVYIDLEKFFDKVNHDKLMQVMNNTIKDLDNSSYFLTITKIQNEHYKIQLKFNGESIDSNNQVRIVTYFNQIKYIKKANAIAKYNCSLSVDAINIIPNIEYRQYIFLNNDYEDLSDEVSGSFYIIIIEHYDTNTNTYFQNAQYYKEKEK